MKLLTRYEKYIYDLEEKLQKMVLESLEFDLKLLNQIWDISLKYQDDGLDINPNDEENTFRYDMGFNGLIEYSYLIIDNGSVEFNFSTYHNELLDLRKFIKIIDNNYSIHIFISPGKKHRKLMKSFSEEVKSHFPFIEVDKYDSFNALGFNLMKSDLT